MRQIMKSFLWTLLIGYAAIGAPLAGIWLGKWLMPKYDRRPQFEISLEGERK